VAAAAAWALLRPGRHLVVVGSLSLWQRAAAGLERSHRRRSRRVTASWLLLLAGAAAAVCASARPVWRGSVPARRIAVAIYPSVELSGPQGARQIRKAARALLDRLDPHDKVVLLVPAVLAGRQEWLSPAQGRKRIDGITPLPVAAREMLVPPAHDGAQHLYRIGPAGALGAGGPNVTTIELVPQLPGVGIDAVGAVEWGGGRDMQLFVAVRNYGRRAWSGRLTARVVVPGEPDARPFMDEAVTIPRGGRIQKLDEAPSAPAVAVRLVSGGRSVAGPGGEAFLVRREAVVRKVAMIGPDEPLLRRFVRVDPTLELVAEAKEADIVLANGEAPPAGTAALVINPLSAPPGWRAGQELSSVLLGRADVAADHPVMRGVDLAGVHVRRLTPWAPGEIVSQKRLTWYKGQAIILCDQPTGASGDEGPPRRVYVAFELNTENTNFSMRDSFVVFLANVVRFLSPPGRARAEYLYQTPAAVGPRKAAKWRPVNQTAGKTAAKGEGPLFAPGLYEDPSGRFHAVSLVGVRPSRAGRPDGPQASSVKLPSPEPTGVDVELWPVLAAGAGLCWLAGWSLRLT